MYRFGVGRSTQGDQQAEGQSGTHPNHSVSNKPRSCAYERPRSQGAATDQIGGIVGHAADARRDVSDGRGRFRSSPRSRHAGLQPLCRPLTGRRADSLGMSTSDRSEADKRPPILSMVCCDRRDFGPRISLRNYKAPNGKLNVTVSKRSPILRGGQGAVSGRLLDIFASLATSSIRRQQQ
jgi:hypothetical protein